MAASSASTSGKTGEVASTTLPALPAVTATRWECTAGSIGYLKAVERVIEHVPPGHVLVQVHSCGLNFADVFAVQGLYSATPTGTFTPGLEFAGVVVALPASSTSTCSTTSTTAAGRGRKRKFEETAPSAAGSALKVGDRVMGVTRFGVSASHHLTICVAAPLYVVHC